MIFDTHAHYDDDAFEEDRDSLLQSMKEGGIGNIVDIGADMESSRKALELSRRYEYMYCAVGVHPSEVNGLMEQDMETLKEWCQEEKVVAVGEIGLDYHYPDTDKDLQKKWFIRQLELAGKVGLPVVIHSRDAAADTLEIMKEYGQGLGGVIHCFSYTKETAAEYLKMGYYFGIGGVLTYKNAKKLVEAVEYLPMEKIVLETDCPYLSPEPFRGKRNSSLNLIYVARKLAELKNLPYEGVVRITTENAKRMYHIL